MQFLLMAYDGTDEAALNRRMTLREEHCQALDACLRNEAYFTEGAWEKVEIKPFRIAKID